MKKYYSTHPSDFKKYDTKEVREKYLLDNLFSHGEVVLNYSFDDRIIVGSVVPTDTVLELGVVEELRSDFFLERRELGMINIGGNGYVVIDGEKFTMNNSDGFYVSMGTKELSFGSDDAANPAKFYINSSPSHKVLPNKHIPLTAANKVVLGDLKTSNSRTINQYVHPAVCESAQLCMGMTILDEGSVWNTFPPHTHDRRMEAYLYFGMDEESAVFHMMGEAEETRHIVVRNEQAIISPSWSIHSGVGTGSYTFIWGMCGENQTFDDMDHIKPSELK
ncbi:5-dehydro-4-deoxy-D-glucuronate isomerase [Mollicutes bacterium LVI A0039]|nr:5-dehydro-4-deoxy-D-glucuronate isomerase [Mollicutes bacterium LVI A0039]